jgi:hypothetical protein
MLTFGFLPIMCSADCTASGNIIIFGLSPYRHYFAYTGICIIIFGVCGHLYYPIWRMRALTLLHLLTSSLGSKWTLLPVYARTPEHSVHAGTDTLSYLAYAGADITAFCVRGHRHHHI